MTEEQKTQIKADLHSGAARVAKSTAEKAKTATGWKKWLLVAAAIVAAAVAWFTTGCTASYRQTASTYNLRRAAVQARVVELVDEDGHVGKFLEWGHYVTNAEDNGYTEFASLEEAKEHFNITD